MRVAVPTSLLATVIATETNWTPSASVVGLALQTRTTMAFVTTSTTAWATSTPVACAMDQAAFTTADAPTSPLEIVIAMATKKTP